MLLLKKTSDDHLTRIYRETGNLAIIDELFERYHHLVLGVCLRYLRNDDWARDAAMEVFESLFEKLLHHNVDTFRSWLYVLTKNHCLMELRKDKKVIEFTDVHLREKGFVENKVEHEEQLQVLATCMAMLHVDQQVCLDMFYFQGFDYKTIALQTGFDLKKIKSAIQNGKRRLRILLEKHPNFEYGFT